MKSVLAEKGFRVIRTLQDNEKSTVVLLKKDNHLFIGKWLNVHSGSWPEKFQNEQQTYKTFENLPPAFSVPKRHPASTVDLLIVSYLKAKPYTPERHILSPLPEDIRLAYLNLCRDLVNWQYSGQNDLHTYDYNARFKKLIERKRVTPEVYEKLVRNYKAQSHTLAPQHGDLIPTNILLDAKNQPALIDWEYAHRYLPGFDLAMLQITTMGDPQFVQAIDQLVHEKGIEAPFNLNKAIVLLREIQIHEVIPDKNDTHKQILPLLRQQWSELLKKL
mgnify:CR=1 FL=1